MRRWCINIVAYVHICSVRIAVGRGGGGGWLVRDYGGRAATIVHYGCRCVVDDRMGNKRSIASFMDRSDDVRTCPGNTLFLYCMSRKQCLFVFCAVCCATK